MIGEEGGRGGFRGFGGRPFGIRFKDGTEVTSTNLWQQGEIPEEYRKLLPDNAEFFEVPPVGVSDFSDVEKMWKEEQPHFDVKKYATGGMAVRILDKKNRPYATISINLEGETPVEGAFWLNDISGENIELAEYLLHEEYIKVTGRRSKDGYKEVTLTDKALGIKKEGGVYDAPATDALMTKQLSERDDYGEGGNGQMGGQFRDWIGDTQTFGDAGQKPVNQPEVWNRKSPQSKTLAEYFKQWAKERWQKIKGIGREPSNAGHPLPPDALSEGYWQKPLPYVGTEGTPTSFMMMPAMKEGTLSPKDIELKKEAINPYGDHNVEITFEFTQDDIKVMCTWEKGDLPPGLDEAQTLARIVQFLEKKLPPTFDRFKHIRMTDVDLFNRTISFEIPTPSIRIDHAK